MYRILVILLAFFALTVSGSLQAQVSLDSSSDSSVKSSIDKRAEAELLASLKAYQEKQYASALVYCERALAFEPEVTSIALLCLQLNIQAEQHERALTLLSLLKAKDAELAQRESFCFMEATLYTKLGRWDAARAAYASCVSEDIGQKAVILSNLAELSMIQGDVGEAIRSYESALELLPSNPHAFFGLAVAWSREGNWRAAHEQYLRGIAVDPNLNFLNEAFFVPEGEDAYHKGVLALLGRDFKRAVFLLKQYLEKEERSEYKLKGQSLLASVEALSEGSGSALLASYPVLLDKVSSIALDVSGRYVAFVQGDMGLSLWVLDLESGKVYERISHSVGLSALSFVGDSTTLRVVGGKYRYVLDVATPDSGYYFYEQSEGGRVLGFSSDGAMIFVSSESAVHRLDFDASSSLDLALVLVNGAFFSASSSVACTSNERVCALLSDEGLLLLDLKLGEVVEAFDADVFEFAQSRPKFSGPFRLGRASLTGVIAAHPSLDFFAVAYRGGVVLIDKRGVILRQFLASGDTGVSALAFDASGSRLAVVSGTLLELWDVDSLLKDHWFSEPTSTP